MRILWVSSSVYSGQGHGGSNSHNSCIKAAFRQLGHEVVEETPVREAVDTLSVQRAAYRRLQVLCPRNWLDWFRDAYSVYAQHWWKRRVAQRVVETKPDLIYERFTDYQSAARVAWAYRIPYILEIHATVEEKALYQRVHFRKRYLAMQCDAAKHAALVVVMSSYLKAYLVRNGIPSCRVIVVPNGVDPELFQPPRKRNGLRDELHLDGSPVIGFVGTLQPFHGVGLLPGVCRCLRQDLPDAKFLVVGGFRSSEAERKFREQLASANVAEHFLLVGRVPFEEVPGYIDAMDIAIIPDSNCYGSPLKLFEYGAMGKACVAPRYGPIEEIVQDGYHALLFEPRNMAALAAAIRRIAKDPEYRSTLGTHLRRKVLTQHTWKTNVARILRAFTDLRGVEQQAKV